MASMDPPRVLVISCGGTISSVRADESGATPVLDAAALVAGVPELSAIARIEPASFSTVPSSHTTLSDVLRLRVDIDRRLAADDGFSGVVVTHGTDTLEEVAFALDLLWDSPVPLVVTGAMRNGSVAAPDGPGNLVAATATAVSRQARGLGVLVVMNDVIHAAHLVRKSHTSNVATFQSPTVGPLGFVSEASAQIVLVPRDRHVLQPAPAAVQDGSVALLTLSIGDDGRLVPALTDGGYRGAVIEALGGGHVTGEMARRGGVTELAGRMPVVLASRTGAGPILRHSYWFPGSEIEMLGAGLVPAGILDGPKARVLLTFLLGADRDQAGIVAAFARYGPDDAARL